MKKKFKDFILRLTILSVAAGLLSVILVKFLPGNIITPALPFLVALFYLVTALVHYILLKITVLNPRRFVSYFMLATFIKLMTYLTVMVVYAFAVKKDVLAFVLAFFCLYIIYTVFEVISILSQTKENHIN
jgi:hypothetical protein